MIWTQTFGTPNSVDEVTGISLNNSGEYVTWSGVDNFVGGAFVHKYDAYGALIWTSQIGNAQYTCIRRCP